MANYVADSDGTGIMYETIAENVATYRNTGEIAEKWSEDINKNNKRDRFSVPFQDIITMGSGKMPNLFTAFPKS